MSEGVAVANAACAKAQGPPKGRKQMRLVRKHKALRKEESECGLCESTRPSERKEAERGLCESTRPSEKGNSMDISNIASMYSDVYSTAANQTANKLQNQLDGSDYSAATKDELMDACKQFEAYFIEQMYKAMLKTVPENEGTSNYASSMMDYYKDQMVQGIAEQTTNQNEGGMGLAQMLYEQMARNYGIDVTGDSAK